jgi:hypothetical protein
MAFAESVVDTEVVSRSLCICCCVYVVVVKLIQKEREKRERERDGELKKLPETVSKLRIVEMVLCYISFDRFVFLFGRSTNMLNDIELLDFLVCD